ncbi:hypothetical protein MUN88_08310 [Gracilibacillus caseinilyticus]|uniref:Uncharacterized protein n=1 Tax=Gracilibacillus caseinilyticus TaxID=2932256 RepID=A0ABY4F062_9BACI|nr:hypothetical protein [Gracilibacillus caseinilyticus]UOQ50050.1 hypothetical protein MUN88_08310 [Gracilibacillus caseinilyticus]
MVFIVLLRVIGIPIAVFFLLKWLYQIKKNSDLQVEQNKKMIQLLEKLIK